MQNIESIKTMFLFSKNIFFILLIFFIYFLYKGFVRLYTRSWHVGNFAEQCYSGPAPST